MTSRLDAYGRTQRRLVRWLVLQSIALLVLAAGFLAGCATLLGDGRSTSETIRVAGLVVVDSTGVERVRLGGNLPDAVIQGQRVPRGESAAGVLVYDAAGQERGGFVTWEPSGNVGIGLDSREGQTALFVAGPKGATALRLWREDDAVELRTDEDGSRFTAIDEDRVVAQTPPIAAVGDEACTAYHEALERFSPGEVSSACRSRYNEPACQECLGTDD